MIMAELVRQYRLFLGKIKKLKSVAKRKNSKENTLFSNVMKV